MRMLPLFSSALALAAQPADAQRRPSPPATKAAPAKKIAAPRPVFSFLGVTPEEAVTSASIGGKECPVSAVGKTECSNPYGSGMKIGNAPIYILLMEFNNGKLYSVIGSVKSFGYADLMAAFTAKYGPPAESRPEKWQSKAGAVFDNTVSTWHFKGGDLTVEAMGSSRDDTDFTFTHPANAPEQAPAPVNF